MSKTAVAILIGAALLFSAPVFAVDGVVLINQSTVMAAGGFPYKITQPGSYKLSGNLVVSGGSDGIDIEASNVSLDLNGFTISGPNTCTGAGASLSCTRASGGYGIFAGPSTTTTIRNGSIVGFDVGLSSNGRTLIDGIHANENYGTGIQIYGLDVTHPTTAVITNSDASFNGFDGIFGEDAIITKTTADYNNRFGVELVVGSLIGTCSMTGNGILPLFVGTGAISQNNNNCDGSVC
jgi:hypothetical protein